MGTHLIKEQSEASVETPPPGKLALFSNSDNSGILSTKDSSDVVRPSGVGTADELATTGAAVVVSAASPPIAGDRLKALTPTAAAWAPDWTVQAAQVGPGPFAADADDLVPVDVTAGPIQVDLPATHTAGQKVCVKVIGPANFIATIDGNGSLIDGDATLDLTTEDESAILVSNGTNWMQVA